MLSKSGLPTVVKSLIVDQDCREELGEGRETFTRRRS